jgi:hypothetical protein
MASEDVEPGTKPLTVRTLPVEAPEVSMYVYYTCVLLLVFSILQHALFPPGRSGPLKPLPALVSTLPATRDYMGPMGDYAATLAALKQARAGQLICPH